MKAKPLPDLSNFSYDPDTGIISRLKKTKNGVGYAGPINNKLNNQKYKDVRINKILYLQHRLAFHLMGIELKDTDCVDHINGIRHDNRWLNLRLVERKHNQRNLKIHREGRIPYIRQEYKGRWTVRKYFKEKSKYFGAFDTQEEAHKHAKELGLYD